jgi:hypothetical protein
MSEFTEAQRKFITDTVQEAIKANLNQQIQTDNPLTALKYFGVYVGGFISGFIVKGMNEVPPPPPPPAV